MSAPPSRADLIPGATSTALTVPVHSRLISLALIFLSLAAPLCVFPGISNPFRLPKELLIVCMSFAGLVFAVVTSPRLRLARPPIQLVDWVLGLYLTLVLLGGFLAVDTSLYDSSTLFKVSLALVYYGAFLCGRVPGAYHWILRALTASGVVVSLVGLIEHLGMGTLFPNVPIMVSTLGYPNFVSQFLLMVLPVTLLHWLKARQNSTRSLLALASGLVLYVNFTSFSRGAWLATLLSLLVLVRLWRGQLSRPPLRLSPAQTVFLVLVLLTAFWLSLPSEFSGRTGFQLAENSSYDVESKEISILNRVEIWRASWRILREHPLGVGAGNFETVYPRYRTREEYIYGALHQRYAHNGFLQVAAEHGWLGLVSFGMFLGIHAYGVAAHRKRFPLRDGIMLSALASALVGMLCHGMVSSNFEQPVPSFLLFLFLGMIRYMTSQVPSRAPETISNTHAAPTGPGKTVERHPSAAGDRLWSLPLISSVVSRVALSVLVMLLFSWIITDSIARLRADAAHGKALQALREDRLLEAISYANRACSLCPGNVEYRYDCARLALLEGRFEDSIEHAHFASRSAPYLLEVRLLLANALNEYGNGLGARSDWASAIGYYTEAVDALTLLNEIKLGEEGRRKSAQAFSNALYNRGNAHYWLEDFTEASRDYEAAIRENPQNHLALSGLGDTLSREGRRDKALEAYRRALKIRPDDQRIRKRLQLLMRSTCDPGTSVAPDS